MATTEGVKRRSRREFTPEFKAVHPGVQGRDRRPVQSRGPSIRQVARDFDLTESSVRRWVEQAQIDAGEREGLTTEERKELSELRRENRRLREDSEILNRATAFFAREIR